MKSNETSQWKEQVLNPTQSSLQTSYNGSAAEYYYYYYYYYYDDYSNSSVSQNYQQFLTGGMNYRCQQHSPSHFWSAFKIFILVTALPPNFALLVLLVRRKIATSSSQILSANLSFLNALYCTLQPLDISTGFYRFSGKVLSVNEAFLVLNLVGCPLLATGMCVERYLAVRLPVLYLQLRKSKYRLVFSILVWIVTLVLAILAYYESIESLRWPLSMGISVLFGLMLLCLGGIITILCKKNPGHNASSTAQKKKALRNVLIILCPFTIAYLPIVALVPFYSVIKFKGQLLKGQNCTILQVLFSFPNVGVYICPMFYLSHLKRHLCRQIGTSTQDQTQGRTTQVFSHSSFATSRNTTVRTQPPLTFHNISFRETVNIQ